MAADGCAPGHAAGQFHPPPRLRLLQELGNRKWTKCEALLCLHPKGKLQAQGHRYRHAPAPLPAAIHATDIHTLMWALAFQPHLRSMGSYTATGHCSCTTGTRMSSSRCICSRWAALGSACRTGCRHPSSSRCHSPSKGCTCRGPQSQTTRTLLWSRTGIGWWRGPSRGQGRIRSNRKTRRRSGSWVSGHTADRSRHSWGQDRSHTAWQGRQGGNTA